MKKIKDMEIIITFGGPCIYKRGVLPNGDTTGRIQDVGQTDDELYEELSQSIVNKRDDVESFISRI